MNKIKRFFKKLHYEHRLNHHLEKAFTMMMQSTNRSKTIERHREMADYYKEKLVKLNERANDH